MKPKIYLDYAAATPIDPKVRSAIEPYLETKFYNPSSLYLSARQVRQDLETARSKIAHILGAKSSEIIYTAGATESINLAILGAARKFQGSKAVSIATEHHAVLACLKALKQEGHPTQLVEVDKNGLTDPADLAKAIDDKTVLVSIAYANNEIGTIQPLSRIGQLVKSIRLDRHRRRIPLPLLLHTDASQAAGALSLAVETLGVDLLSLGGSKIYGPAQSGILYSRRGADLNPVVYGGGQEKGLRSGTESASSAIGLASALELVHRDRAEESRRLTALRDHAIKKLAAMDGVTINGSLRHRLPGNINLIVDGISGEQMVLYLDEAGIQVSTGAACTTGQSEPSHVLLAIGLTKEQANSSLRITLGRQTTKSDVDCFLKSLPKVVSKLGGSRELK